MKRLLFLLIGLAIFVSVWGLFFYKGYYFSPTLKEPGFEKIAPPSYPPSDFSDIVPEKGSGKIVVDLSHDNHLVLSEINVLLARLVSRGFSIEVVSEAKDFRSMLSGANALIVACPKKSFPEEDRKAVVEFAKGGKKLLLIGDPTRASQINSLSLAFNLIFESDYLYNLKENEANYRNIFVRQFTENAITRDLKRIALYTAGSITSPDLGIVFTDENTFSSLSPTKKNLSPIALAKDGKVLAIYDLTFFTEPWNTAADNNQLITNIANWLTGN